MQNLLQPASHSDTHSHEKACPMRILLINTGGTIGMAETRHGFAPRDGVIEAAIAQLTEQGATTAQIDVMTLSPLIDGAQATPRDWNRISTVIAEAIERYHGFVVVHGTDTLAYTSSALCLALTGITVPVIVTGAMLPLTVEGSDGLRNLTDALTALRRVPPGVWVQFSGRLLHGGRVRKSHSSAFEAFEAAEWTADPRVLAPNFAHRKVDWPKIGVFSPVPGTSNALLAQTVDLCDGVLLRCYGSGTAPDTPEMWDILGRAAAQEVPILAVSQCPEGGIRLGTYAAGRVMRDNGVIDGRDITPEMAYAKLQFALSLYPSFDRQKNYLSSLLCGEFTPE